MLSVKWHISACKLMNIFKYKSYFEDDIESFRAIFVKSNFIKLLLNSKALAFSF